MRRDETVFRLDALAGRERQFAKWQRGLRREAFPIQLPSADGGSLERAGATRQRGGTLLQKRWILPEREGGWVRGIHE